MPSGELKPVVKKSGELVLSKEIWVLVLEEVC
jgi:hypothetical protein